MTYREKSHSKHYQMIQANFYQVKYQSKNKSKTHVGMITEENLTNTVTIMIIIKVIATENMDTIIKEKNIRMMVNPKRTTALCFTQYLHA